MKVFCFLGLLFFSGCSSLGQSVILGGGVGMVEGVMVGKSFDFNQRGMALTVGLGFVIGMGVGYLLHAREIGIRQSACECRYPRLIVTRENCLCVVNPDKN